MWCGRPAADQPQDGARLPGAAAGPHGRRRAAGTDCGWRGLLLDSAECPDFVPAAGGRVQPRPHRCHRRQRWRTVTPACCRDWQCQCQFF